MAQPSPSTREADGCDEDCACGEIDPDGCRGARTVEKGACNGADDQTWSERRKGQPTRQCGRREARQSEEDQDQREHAPGQAGHGDRQHQRGQAGGAIFWMLAHNGRDLVLDSNIKPMELLALAQARSISGVIVELASVGRPWPSHVITSGNPPMATGPSAPFT